MLKFSTINMDRGNISQSISKALADALGDDESEPESLYAFLIYMQLGIIKAAYPSIKAARRVAIKLLKYLSKPGDTDGNYHDIKILFDNTQDTLLEIIEETWYPPKYNPDLAWMDKW